MSRKNDSKQSILLKTQEWKACFVENYSDEPSLKAITYSLIQSVGQSYCALKDLTISDILHSFKKTYPSKIVLRNHYGI
jgi:hypothetical protein